MAINTSGFSVSNHFPLRIAGGGNTAFMNIINGNNLVRKSAQLVNDIEGLRGAPKTLDALKTLNSSTAAINETSFQTLVDKIKEQLDKSDKPFTLLNVVGAQQELIKLAEEKPEVDKTA